MGYLGERLSDLPKRLFGLDSIVFCDGNDSKVEDGLFQGKCCLFKHELMEVREDYLVFVLVDYPYDEVIVESLSGNHCLHTLTMMDLLNMDLVMKDFYGESLYSELCNNSLDTGDKDGV